MRIFNQEVGRVSAKIKIGAEVISKFIINPLHIGIVIPKASGRIDISILSLNTPTTSGTVGKGCDKDPQ